MHLTLARPHTHDGIPTKGSRFVGIAAPVSTDDEAMATVDAARRSHGDASHHAWAYRLLGGRHRHHDAGEPASSAGRPILAQIDGHDLHDVIVVVARWFGGTKLGVGGLVRAYGGCAGRTLDRAEIVERFVHVTLAVRHRYDDTGPVQAVVGSLGLEVLGSTFSAEVRTLLSVPEAQLDEVIRALRDRTSGRVEAEPVDG